MALMTEQDWSNIKHFKKTEDWGDWTKMDREIFYILDAMREDAGPNHPFIIHCGYENGGHSNQSQHYIGLAVDLHIKNMSLIDQYLLAERYGWTGIGVYTDWNNPGLHLDLRKIGKYEKGARWGRRKKLFGGTEYVALDKAFIEHVIDGGY